jgi:ubiquinone/menaquinone biosynthesis C-methylase UbiE
MTLSYRLLLAVVLASGMLSLTASRVIPLGMPIYAQEKSVKPGINDAFKNPDINKYLKTFEGESREIYQQRQKIVAVCALRQGMVVADIGAGTGLFTRLFAQEVGPEGKVYAVDISEKFLAHIERTCRDAGLRNVITVQGSDTSPNLPPQSVDLVFLCDTYHHFEYPFRMMTAIHAALKPHGKVVLIDFHRIPGKSSEWVLGHVRAGQEVFEKEILSCGFRKLREEKELGLKENYCLIFEKVMAERDGSSASEKRSSASEKK